MRTTAKFRLQIEQRIDAADQIYLSRNMGVLLTIVGYLRLV